MNDDREGEKQLKVTHLNVGKTTLNYIINVANEATYAPLLKRFQWTLKPHQSRDWARTQAERYLAWELTYDPEMVVWKK